MCHFQELAGVFWGLASEFLAPLAETRNGTTQNDTFGYNSRSELVSATLGNDNYSYAFDAIGNRETSSESGTALAYAANNLNQYTEIASSESSASFAFNPTYDADGNATMIQTSTGTWTIAYNAENRPVRFENAGTQTNPGLIEKIPASKSFLEKIVGLAIRIAG